MTNDTPHKSLLALQWEGYPRVHADRRNLAIHAVAVPGALIGMIAIVAATVTHWWIAPIGFALLAVSLRMQGVGHAREAAPPVPFASPGEAVARLWCEQWITFPRFVLSGGFARAWRAARRGG